MSNTFGEIDLDDDENQSQQNDEKSQQSSLEGEKSNEDDQEQVQENQVKYQNYSKTQQKQQESNNDLSNKQQLNDENSVNLEENEFLDEQLQQQQHQNQQNIQQISDNIEDHPQSYSQELNTPPKLSQEGLQYNEEETVYQQCPNCNRNFFEGKLQYHLKSCTSSKRYKSSQKNLNKSNYNEQQQQNENNINKNDQGTKNQISQDYNIQKSLTSYQKQIQMEEEQNQENQEEGLNEDNQDQIQADDDRVECTICNRKFFQERIDKHIKVCSKQTKKRKVFNSKQARLPDEAKQYQVNKNNKEEVKYVKTSEKFNPMKAIEEAKKNRTANAPWKKQQQPKTADEGEEQIEDNKTNTTNDTDNTNILKKKNSKQEEKNERQKKWQIEHQSFQMQMQLNKKIAKIEKEGGDVSKLRQEQQDSDPLLKDYIQCKYCNRKFNKQTAERHIPLCKDIINRPKPQFLKKKSMNVKTQKQMTLEKGTPPRPPQKSENNLKQKNNTKQTLTPSNKQSSSNFIIQEQDEDPNNTQENSQRSNTEGGDKNNRSSRLFRIRSKQDSVNGSQSNQSTIDQSGIQTPSNSKQQEKRSFSVNRPSNKQKLPDINSSSAKGIRNSQNNSNNNNFKLIKKYGMIDGETKNLSDKKPPRVGSSPLKGQYNIGQQSILQTESNLQQQKYEGVQSRSQNYSTQQCPYCDRNFAKPSAERHIPICKNLLNRPNPKRSEQRFGTQQLTQNNFNQSTTNKFGIKAKSPLKKVMNQTQISNHFCTNCGYKSVQQHKYCGNCGKKKLPEQCSTELQ